VSHLRSGSLALGGNALTSLDGFSGLVEVTSLSIVESSLTSLRGFESLTEVGTLAIHDNSSLPSCEVDWLLAHVGAPNIDLIEDVSNNTGTGTCPP